MFHRGTMGTSNPASFKIDYRTAVLRGDRYGRRCNAVVLHGAGTSSRERFARLRRALNACGVPTVSFDYIGHGETGGALIGSSLAERTAQAAAVIERTAAEPLTLIGASMSGYTAVTLTRHFRVANLVLLVPAVYTAAAYRLPFGPAFSQAIRAPGSWRASDAWDLLARFRGNLLVIAAEQDDVIPREIVEGIYASAAAAAHRRLLVVPGSRHVSLFPEEGDLRLAVDMIAAMCRHDAADGARPASDTIT
jgi:pimeloyl-ACP methyl ester carboxylesterase